MQGLLRVSAAMAAAGLSALAAHPAAAQAAGGWYVGLTAIGAIENAAGRSADGFAGPSTIDGEDEIVAGLGGTVGYVWPDLPLRTELELAHRYRFDFDAQDAAPGGTVDFAANVATTSLLVNAVLEWRNGSAFTPFAGITFGVAHHNVDTKRTDPAGPDGKRDRNAAEFAWGGMLGVDWNFSDRWTAGIAYRFLDLGEIDTGRLAGGERIRADHLYSHDLLLSARYRF